MTDWACEQERNQKANEHMRLPQTGKTKEQDGEGKCESAHCFSRG